MSLQTDIRNDQISWINDSTVAGIAWIAWIAELQSYLNAHLFLGLFSFESHYAHYGPGCFYGRHQDAFHGDANRVLSLIVYLNPEWQAGDAGELVLYTGTSPEERLVIHPQFGTLVMFLSEDIEHEVLVTNKDRRSIAGWFHLNQSHGGLIDPPS
ncbi:2OG-Fe(II) oxygenase [Granulosicoccus antarcticus]|uniref:2OG-Fe(II) oxygenase n=1 Tax=Granulosicoccus antarcticus TaxID=437505 RepID=UPI00197ABB09|nr:2OG-Fe(II) oxygenase [Granulosicoccus antarcticus]